MTSLNAPGFSITLLNVTHTARVFDSGKGEQEILDLIDAPQASAAWPGSSFTSIPETLRARTRQERYIEVTEEPVAAQVEKTGPKVNGKLSLS